VQEFPRHAREVGAGFDGRQKARGKAFSLTVRLPLKERVLKPCQGDRDSELALIVHMIGGMQGAAYRAPFAAFPILAVHDLISLFMLQHAGEVFCFDRRIAVKGVDN